MNRLRKNIAIFCLSTLPLLFFTTPNIAFAADEGASFAQEIIWGILVAITGTFLRIAGIVFDYGINTFVVGFEKLYTTSGVGFAVDNAWVTIRDFVNLFFIFGLVYIGIKLILDANDSNTRRWLVNLVIAALLINFSLFITKFVVDFSNQLSYQIAQGAGWYNNAAGQPQTEVKMSEKILLYMGITEIFNLSGDTLNNASWGYIFGTAIFFTITAFILIAGGFLLIIRFAMLNLFLVMSPLMFLSWVLPPLSDTMERYWKGFIGRAFFAPVYFMFMYFSLEILKGFQTYIKGGLGNAGSNMAQTLAGENGKQVLTSTQSTMPFFFLICIFMIASLVIASKMGADFGDKAVGMGKSLSNKAGNYAKRGAINTGKFAGRTAGGGFARGVNEASSNLRSRYDRLAIRAQNSTSMRGRIANRLIRGTDGVTQRALGAGESASVFGSETLAQQTARREAYRNRVRQAENQNRRSDAASASAAAITENSTQEQIDERINSQRQRQNNIARMSNEELLDFIRTNREAMEAIEVRAATGEYNEADLAEMREGVVDTNSREFLALLSDAQMTAFEGSGILNNPEIQAARQARDEGALEDVQAILQNSNASSEQLNEALDRFSQIVQGFSPDRLNDTLMRQINSGQPIPPSVAASMTNEQFTAFRNSGRASREQIQAVRQAREAGLSAVANHGSMAGGWVLGANNQVTFVPNTSAGATATDANGNRRVDRRRNIFQNAQEAGRMPASVLSNRNIAEHLTPQVIAAFMQNNPSGPDMDAVRANVEQYINGNGADAERARTAFERWQQTDLGARFGATIRNNP